MCATGGERRRGALVVALLCFLAVATGLSPGLLPRHNVACLRAPPALAGVRRKVKRDAQVETSRLKEDMGFGADLEAVAVPAALPATARPGVEPIDVFALPAEAASLIALRLPTSLAQPGPSSYVDLFSSLRAAMSSAMGDDAALTVFVAANRDLLEYRFQYKLSAQVLAAQNLGDVRNATDSCALRDAVVKACLRFDAPLFPEIGQAEQRLGQMLGEMQAGATPDAAEMVAAAGGAPQQRLAFWAVTSAAIAAWESKIDLPSVTDLAKYRLGELGRVREAIESDAGLLASAGVGALAPLVRWRLPAEGASDEANMLQAKATLAGMAPLDAEARTALLRFIGCLREQCNRHSYQVRRHTPLDAHVHSPLDTLHRPRRAPQFRTHRPPGDYHQLPRTPWVQRIFVSPPHPPSSTGAI